MAKTSYAIALGSNRRSRHGSPRETIGARGGRGLEVERLSPIIDTAGLGPAGRCFANAGRSPRFRIRACRAPSAV
jgi:2-amino-4-hydroxy-6-hydroxymethyldihydropteridine diphosphokinase